MGARNSKEPIIIYNEPEVPIQLTPNLLRKLDGQAPDPLYTRLPHPAAGRTPLGGAPPTPFDSPFPQHQQHQHQQHRHDDDESIEAAVQSRVARQVDLHQQKRLVNEKRSAEAVAREAEDVLRRQRLPPKGTPKADCVAAENAVVTCYRNNPETPLNYWREVETMKATARLAQREFVEAH
ncbi:uncharacterized protein EV422DRAFT_535088 [Fimicolochytrium jonesii]|uniref:uncharacterized protein n=1 Tax=Fimicolochytrium jonesii TaxID=1396493 RepID=UPI0022FE397F|nr:uncharacterized protein EV422DRAFT_535088 [Fimicolochytrium jonesii]KAI8819093.1 hypothetical protein EV422DRAFT_535088 [Fimicolochytrium jonesii]